MAESLFAACGPGLEPILRAEMAALGLVTRPGPAETGGVSFEGGISAVQRANLHLRTASRVLLRMGNFYAAAFSELRKKASRLPWERYLAGKRSLALRVTCHKSRLYHTGGVAERLAGAIGDRLGQPVELTVYDEEAASPPQLVLARLDHDLCTLSLDTSGELLHRRGYRLETAKAPLRETLAAGMLLACGYDGSGPFLDPFCGSGTLPIEAALLAGNIAPGKLRRFAFMDWPGFDVKLWRALVDEARMGEHAPLFPILGSDRDAGAVAAAQANAGRARVNSWTELSQRAVSAVEPPPGAGWVVTNPPYGVRVSQGRDLRDLYAQFGNVLRARFDGWKVGFLCSDRVLAGQVGLKLEPPLKLVNGGISVGLYRSG
jgi:putative N6-adenine-specific DNA methylase